MVQIRQHIQVLLGKGCSRPNSIWDGMFGPVEWEFRLAIFKIKISSPNGPDDYLKETSLKPFKRLRLRRKYNSTERKLAGRVSNKTLDRSVGTPERTLIEAIPHQIKSY